MAGMRDQITQVRSRLEERFQALERALQADAKPARAAERGEACAVVEAPRAQAVGREGGRGEEDAAGAAGGLQRDLEAVESDRQALKRQVMSLEAELRRLAEEKRSAPSQPAAAAGVPSVEAHAEACGKKRSLYAKFLKRRMQTQRAARRLLGESALRNRDLAGRIARLSGELDAAMELVAELRDEINAVSHQSKGA